MPAYIFSLAEASVLVVSLCVCCAHHFLLQTGSPLSSQRSRGTVHLVWGALQSGASSCALVCEMVVNPLLAFQRDGQGQSVRLCVAINSSSMTASNPFCNDDNSDALLLLLLLFCC